MKTIINFFQQNKGDTEIFDSVRGNNPKLTRKFINQYGQIDERPNNPETGIYNGFYAIHYSIVCNAYECFTILLQKEFDKQIGNSANIRLTLLNNKTLYIPKNADCIHLAIVMQNPKMLTDIIQYALSQKSNVIDTYFDFFKNNHLMIFTQFALCDQTKQIINTNFKHQFFILTQHNNSYIQSIFKHKRVDHLINLLEVVQSNTEEYLSLFLQQIIWVYSDYDLDGVQSDVTLYDAVLQQMDFKHNNIKPVNVIIMAKFFGEAVKYAVNYFSEEEKLKKYGKVVQKFYQNYSNAKFIKIEQTYIDLEQLIKILTQQDFEQISGLEEISKNIDIDVESEVDDCIM